MTNYAPPAPHQFESIAPHLPGHQQLACAASSNRQAALLDGSHDGVRQSADPLQGSADTTVRIALSASDTGGSGSGIAYRIGTAGSQLPGADELLITHDGTTTIVVPDATHIATLTLNAANGAHTAGTTLTFNVQFSAAVARAISAAATP